MNVVVAGSSGLIGSELVDRLSRAGHTVTRLVRPQHRSNPTAGARASDRGAGAGSPGTPTRSSVAWDPVGGPVDVTSLLAEGPVEAVVNLAGAGIGDRRWSARRKQEVRESRLRPTRRLVDMVETLAARDSAPGVLLNASAVGYYGDRGEEAVTEASGPGTGFLAELCVDWEATALRAAEAGVRTVLLRSGIVLAPAGGALGRQVPLFRLGLGGRLGTGRQFRSWISLEDEVSAILRCLEDERIAGAVNLCAPQPVTDAEFASALGAVLGRPARLRVPGGALRLALGSELASEVLLAGQRVLPAVLESVGFSFDHPVVDDALRWALRGGS